jgi:hypothetical protein
MKLFSKLTSSHTKSLDKLLKVVSKNVQNKENTTTTSDNVCDFTHSEINSGILTGYYTISHSNPVNFDWECNTYLSLIDSDITAPVLSADKSTLKIRYDVRGLTPLHDLLQSFNNTRSQSSFTLFVHDLMEFVTHMNETFIHTRMTPYNVFYDESQYKFYVVDIGQAIVKEKQFVDIFESSSDLDTKGLKFEHQDLLHTYQILHQIIQDPILKDKVSKIFKCYIPCDLYEFY